MTPPTTRATPCPSPATKPRVISRVLAIGLIAGLVAGLAVAALQQVTTTPLILAAEVYESAQHSHAEPVAEGWKPAEGAQRIAATGVADIATAAGYALILLALMLVAGDTIEPRRALAWAACAFVATGLATGLGLGPQLPGAAETDLFARQLWWAGTAAATGAGLFALLRRDEFVAKILGAALVALPHIVGAPRPAAPESTAPAELAAQFAASSLAVQAITWALAGALVGVLWREVQARDALKAMQ
jgi:cobalt transporter subunit CbtA